ncbi:MAG: CarD family transcriptional regulator [Clostridia bacterium]|nr:CarD family transcriptional regulator [Clostridia bacterium]
MFKTDDVVIYGTYGICKIESTATRSFMGEDKEYYVLRPLFTDKNVFYIPVGSETANNRLHGICSRKTAEKLIKQMKSAEPLWIENDAKRREEFNRVINSGNKEEIIRMIKGIRLRRTELEQSGKKLRSFDESYLVSAEKMLCDELSCALEIERDKIVEILKNGNE